MRRGMTTASRQSSSRYSTAIRLPRWAIPSRHTLAYRVSVPSEVSVNITADAPVALVDHARAERPGLDQLQRDIFGDRRYERRAGADEDRIAEHAQLVDEA